MEPNLAELSEAVAAAIPDRECLVWRDRRLVWRELSLRIHRLASFLTSRSLGLHRERSDAERHAAVALRGGRLLRGGARDGAREERRGDQQQARARHGACTRLTLPSSRKRRSRTK